ncbi:MAG: DUF3667 domain-containing protein [Aquaticitalea sp.]
MDCKNCHSTLSENASYCYDCGGKVIRNRLTLRNLFEHLSETFLNYDNKFLQTFIGLFRKPEYVIGTYINGTRKRYVNVVSYFAIAITLSGLQLYILNKFFPDALDISTLDTSGSDMLKESNFMAILQEYQSIIMMLYVPLYAIISRVVFLNKKTYNYTEQLVIYMYIQAQTSISAAIILTLLVMVGFNYFALSYFYIAAMVLYSAYCLKRLYQLTTSEIILKTLIFGLIIGALMVLIVIIMFAVMFMNGSIQEVYEAGKAAKGS